MITGDSALSRVGNWANVTGIRGAVGYVIGEGDGLCDGGLDKRAYGSALSGHVQVQELGGGYTGAYVQPISK